MAKIAQNSSVPGTLRDIRFSGFKPHFNGNGGQRINPELMEESLQQREQEGYQRGLREAQEESERKFDQLKQEWEQVRRGEITRLFESLNQSIQQQFNETSKALEKHLVVLAGEAAIKLISGLPICADSVEAYIREAMNLVEQDTEIIVAIHPDDLALLEEKNSGLLTRNSSFPVLKYRPDPKISRGGCLLETRFGELDARRETRIELLRKAVNE